MVHACVSHHLNIDIVQMPMVVQQIDDDSRPVQRKHRCIGDGALYAVGDEDGVEAWMWSTIYTMVEPASR